MTLVLRFRDLNIPDGATIDRHKSIVSAHGEVLWGWVMRQSEEVPEAFLAEISENTSDSSPQEILLYDSGACRFYSASLADIYSFPNGLRIPTPEARITPAYMAEALCPAWFRLVAIDEMDPPDSVIILAYPTIAAVKEVDREKLNKAIPPCDLRDTAATLWNATII